MTVRIGINGFRRIGRLADRPVTYSSDATPGAVVWADHGVDIVLESSGKFKTSETLQPHLAAGARKVIVAAPVKSDGGVLNLVMGCNDDLYGGSVTSRHGR